MQNTLRLVAFPPEEVSSEVLVFPEFFVVRLRELEEEHDSRLQALRSDFLRDAAAATSAGSVEAALSTNGGWSPERHFRSVWVSKTFAQFQARTVARGRELVSYFPPVLLYTWKWFQTYVKLYDPC